MWALAATVPGTAVSLAPMTMTAVEITDGGNLTAWPYGAKELQDGAGPSVVTR